VELSPHTLRRSFATYHAEAGLSLPILAKILGHSSIRTTALYWKNTYQDPNNEVGPILAGKNWLESREPPKLPITENFPEKKGIYSELSQIPKNPKPIFINHKPLIPNKNPTHANNSLSIKKTTAKSPEKLISEISPISQETFLLNNPSQKPDQLKTTQPLALIANQEQKSTESEVILLAKIKHLESQLTQVQAENNNLTAKLTKNEREKTKLAAIAEQEKQRANNYQQQLKVIIKSLYQWQKINYYRQLEQEAQIEQSPKPSPQF